MRWVLRHHTLLVDVVHLVSELFKGLRGGLYLGRLIKDKVVDLADLCVEIG